MYSFQNAGMLRSPAYDITLIAGLPLLAISCGFLVAHRNDLFFAVLAADLWLLGYHHVVATYSRLSFDRQSFAEHKNLIVYLLPAVVGTVAVVASLGGAWLITTIYLHWQWWHYTRQSEGISKAYGRKASSSAPNRPILTRAAFYSVPVLGMMTVSHRGPAEFLFFPVRTVAIPDFALLIAQILTPLIVTWFIVDQVRRLREGRTSVAYLAYVVSHFLIYFVAYIFLAEINYGWLTINIWHNAQYLLFVWLYNNRRFNGKPEARTSFLPAISQDGRMVLYFAACITITSIVYYLVLPFFTDAVAIGLAVNATMASLIIYQAVNFHHYIVDSIIWKLRKPKLASTLQLNRS